MEGPLISDSLDEDRLVEAAQAGDARAFGRLVDRHQRAVRGFLRRVCGDAVAAEDLAQETFLFAWTRLERFDRRASLRAWLCGIAWRKASEARRGRARSQRRDAAFLGLSELEAGSVNSPDDRVALNTALAELPPDQRAAIALCLAADFSHAEAAEALSLPLGTVKSHVARGRTRLLAALGGSEGHD